MSERLIFLDAETAADALTFSGRAAAVGDGTVRLRAVDGVLAMTCAPLAPVTLLDDTPTVIGMRALPVDPELVCDLVVEASALTPTGAASVVLPEVAVSVPWAGIAPPRAGWERVGMIDSAVIEARAAWGSAAVARALPSHPGEDVVRTVRASVWGEADDDLGGLPRGVAFAARALGFLGEGEPAGRFRAGPWSRVSLRRGHVLSRRRTTSGLTQVRATGGR
ncbi:hypothetical protein [Microbacterium sp.]|uniref:hypothetical protein n=1 Tax=Microbacterium sp. TaxID=51671 RepID=UPI003A8A8176